jgi:rhodanese-related sulfurtransferase|tara:strand:- start:126 stop:440 length:315 start_codon:yes stop_codon:yes gene_type:complete
MIKQIKVKELNAKLVNNEVVLIDVREQDELEICSIEKAVHIPMNNIPSSIDQFDKETIYAIMCHSGIRSHNVSFYLQNMGFNVMNVEGGINEWANVIDGSMKKY